MNSSIVSYLNSLTIECNDEEGMRYRAATSDLMFDGELVPECVKLRSVTLSNRTQVSTFVSVWKSTKIAARQQQGC